MSDCKEEDRNWAQRKVAVTAQSKQRMPAKHAAETRQQILLSNLIFQVNAIAHTHIFGGQPGNKKHAARETSKRVVSPD